MYPEKLTTRIEADFFKPEQLADKLSISLKTVTKWTQERRIPGQCKIGGVWRYRKVDIEKRLLSGDFLLPKALQ